ncbi:hypothetical protein [Sinorhizobium sp. BJ1]|uniref:hypothetical protein n=1 Tax=Sinorhizobium sp. BJ1 TaxID=2035455 RepID=UPI0015CF4069|nr:hypothetical protein [Sinorhizobium sp. BJ1]
MTCQKSQAPRLHRRLDGDRKLRDNRTKAVQQVNLFDAVAVMGANRDTVAARQLRKTCNDIERITALITPELMVTTASRVTEVS